MSSKPSFAAALKTARERAGLSQAALARRAGLTGSYVCVLEARRRRPPSPRVVAALAKALGIEDGPLQELAALERSPGEVRRRIEHLDRERGRALRSRDRVLTTTLFHIAHRPTVMNPLGVGEFPDLSHLQRSLLGRLVDRVRGVRTVEEAQDRADEILEDAAPGDRDALASVLPHVFRATDGPPVPPVVAPIPTNGERRPVGTGVAVPIRERLEALEVTSSFVVDASLASTGAFLWRSTTDEAWPRVERGDLLLLDPEASPANGDLVAFERSGVDHVRVFSAHGEEVRLQSARADEPPLRLPASEFRAAGVVRWILRAL